MTFWVYSEKAKIGVSCKREHRLQGSRGSENHEISRLKSEEVKSVPWGSTFLFFCEFWAQWDPKGLHFCLKMRVFPDDFFTF